MADFCKQCSLELFNEDFKDLANLGGGKYLPPGSGWQALCEGCGMTMVDGEGVCMYKFCPKHGEGDAHAE